MTGHSRRIALGPSRRVAAIVGLVAILSAAWLRADDGRGDPLPPRALARIGTDDLRTRRWVASVAFSPDGRRIAAAEGNTPAPTVTLFDVRTGRPVRVLTAPASPGWVDRLAFSPDGTRLLSGGGRGWVALWDLTADRLMARQQLHRGEIAALGFSPDGRLMATASGDAILLSRVDRPLEVVGKFSTRPVEAAGDDPEAIGRDGVQGLAFSSDGTRLAAVRKADAILFVWRVEDGRMLHRTIGAHGRPRMLWTLITDVAFTPDGRRIMTAARVRMPDERKRPEFGPNWVETTEVRFRDAETGRLLAEMGDDEPGAGHASLSPDGRRVAVGDFRGVTILDAATGVRERTVAMPDTQGHAAVFSPDGTLLARPWMNGVALGESATGRRLHHDGAKHAGPVLTTAWSPSGDRIATGHLDGIVRAWDTSTGRPLWHDLPVPAVGPDGILGAPRFAAFSKEGDRVLTARSRNNPKTPGDILVTVFDATNGRRIREYAEHRGRLRHAALANDRRMLVLGVTQGSNHDTHFLGIDWATGRMRWSTPPAEQSDGFGLVEAMRFRAGSPLLEVALSDGGVIRLNSLTGREMRRFLADYRTPAERRAGRPAEPRIWTAAFSPDGRALIASQLQWIYIWDLESGALRRRIEHPHRHHCHLAVAPDGKMIATSDVWYGGDYGSDTVRLFDITTGRQVLALDPPDGRAEVLTFSPDGSKLFTGFDRGSGIVWDVRLPETTAGARE